MTMKIRKAIELAEEKSYTRGELMEYFHISEEEYKKQFASFSKPNRDRLRCLLISNGKKKKSQNKQLVTKENITSVSTTSSNRTILIPDTSYILSRYCRLESLEGAHLLSSVYEQLVIREKRGKIGFAKIKKLFYMMLDGRVNIELVKDKYFKGTIPDYEDLADLEIIAYAKNINSKNFGEAVVYTCDKVLALSCKQQNIKYKFFDISNSDSKPYPQVSEVQGVTNISTEKLNEKNRGLSYSERIIERRGDHYYIKKDSNAVALDNKKNVKKKNKIGLIELESGDTIVYGSNKYYFEGGKIKAI